jgi:hypothetical protein
MLLLLACAAPEALTLAASTDPDPAQTGVVVVHLEADWASGEAVTEGLSVVPWMPAHGHGTTAEPTLAKLGDGAWELTVDFAMAGIWEMQVQADAEDRYGEGIVELEVE